MEWIFCFPRKAFGVQEQIASAVLAKRGRGAELSSTSLRYSGPWGFCFLVSVSSPIQQIITLAQSSLTHKNEIGIPHILMSKAPGILLSSFVWDDDDVAGHDKTWRIFNTR